MVTDVKKVDFLGRRELTKKMFVSPSDWNCQKGAAYQIGYGQKSRLFKIDILERSKKVDF